MKDIDSLGLQLCKMQGDLFVASKRATGGSAVFIRRFMNSAVAKRMDDGTIAFSAEDKGALLAEIAAEYNNKEYGKEKYADEELYWIGYLYRYWSYCAETTSKCIYKTIGAREMRELYYPYHSLDPKQAIERIKEAKNAVREDEVEDGVKILRRIIHNNKDKK